MHRASVVTLQQRQQFFSDSQPKKMATTASFTSISSDAGDGSGARKTSFLRSESGGDVVLLSYREVVRLWQSESLAFRDVFIASLKSEEH